MIEKLSGVLSESVSATFGDTAAQDDGAGGSSDIGVAVSGGGDSMALLDMLRRWGQAKLCVVSVHHGLRAEADDEIAQVAAYANSHGLDHDILHWRWDGLGGVQAAARDGRRNLIRDWAKRRGLSHVALGHTADDQAETVLMRLARGSGVDGLAAMQPARVENGLTWLRPLLDVRRDELRDYLRARGLGWADDPSNEDTRFDRVKARKALAVLQELGLTVPRLVQTAAHMSRARDALDLAADQLAQTAVSQHAGDLLIARDLFEVASQDAQYRLMARALGWVSGQVYRPRFKALTAVLKTRQPRALQGCLVLPKDDSICITRELAAVAAARCQVGEVWDGRWQVFAPEAKQMYTEALQIAALGARGLAQIPTWRDTGLARQSLLASPAIWHDETLIAAPLAGLEAGWRVTLLPHRAHFA